MSLTDLAQQLRERPLVLGLHQAVGTAAFTPLARITLHSLLNTVDAEAPSFDPILHCPNSVRLQPEWLRASREVAYDNSRRGRRGE